MAWIGVNRCGIILLVAIALASSFLAENHGTPAMLFALLLGMSFNFLSDGPRTAPGIDISSVSLLRADFALTGLRLTFADVSQLGITPIIGIAGMQILTIIGSVIFARLFGCSLAFGLLTGGSVAICGTSAAMAITAMLPKKFPKEEDVLLIVVGVTALGRSSPSPQRRHMHVQIPRRLCGRDTARRHQMDGLALELIIELPSHHR